MSLKLGAPEGVQCDEILATFDDGEVKLVNVKEEIERQHQQLAKATTCEREIKAASSSSSAATTKTTEEDADADENKTTLHKQCLLHTPVLGGKRRRFQNMRSTSTSASKHGALKICSDSVVSSQTYLIAERHTKKMMQSKGEDTSNICSSSSSSSSSSNHDVEFSLVAFGFANGVIEVHSMEDGKNDYDKEDAYSSLNNRHYSHKGAVRCLAQVKSPLSEE